MGSNVTNLCFLEQRNTVLHEQNSKMLRGNYTGDFREMEGPQAETISVSRVDLSRTSKWNDGMVDPVIAADGHTYERASIEQYIRARVEKGLALRSPITNEPLTHTMLTPVSPTAGPFISNHQNDLMSSERNLVPARYSFTTVPQTAASPPTSNLRNGINALPSDRSLKTANV